MKRIILSLLVMFCFSPLFSQVINDTSWVYVGKSANGDDYYVRSKNVEKIGSQVKVWTKIVYKSWQKIGNTYYVQPIQLRLEKYDCSRAKQKLYSFSYYSNDGKLLETDKREEWETEWVDIIPDSMGEAKYNVICSSNK
jgi:hypothetical protein